MEQKESQIIEKFKKNGIPLPLSLTESNVVTTTNTSNLDLLKKIENMKRGSNKQVIKDMINSDKTDTAVFSPLPTARKNNPQNQKQGTTVEVQKFAPKSDPELSAIENLFGGGGGFSTDDYFEKSPAANMEQNTGISDVNFKSMPSLDDALAKKKQSFMSYANNNQQAPVQQEQKSQEIDSFNFNNLKKLMEEVARDTMEKVLDEYTEKKKNKHLYEVVTVDSRDGKTIIKTETGQHFKLTPVEVVKKKS